MIVKQNITPFLNPERVIFNTVIISPLQGFGKIKNKLL
jgi:hypothetical protein